MLKKLSILSTIILTAVRAIATDPTETLYSASQCEGSMTPYPTNIGRVATPDSLEVVMINHIGRHGSRYQASSTSCMKLQAALIKADSLGTLTDLGRKMMALNENVIARTAGRWGALDSLGMAEQRAIATRMYNSFSKLFDGGTVKAYSSYSPRVMMSMMEFVHQLDRLNNKPDFTTSSGRVNSPLLRPFDVDRDYIEFRKSDITMPIYDEHIANVCPTAPITRILGKDYPFENADEWRKLAMYQYYVLAGLSAMGMKPQFDVYYTPQEYNALWSCFNLRQYLQRTATTLSSTPAEIASALVMDIIDTTDRFITGTYRYAVTLRFGHAETIMPLASLLRLPGGYYMTNYFDTVALHWHDFDVAPMAANIQFILFKVKKTNRYYVRVDYNERPMTLIPNNDAIYLPWKEAREYMLKCVPLYAQ